MQFGVRGSEFGVRTFLLSFILVLFASLSSCTGFRSPQPSLPPSAELPSAQQLLARLDARRQALASLRGLARVVYIDTQDKGTAKQAIAVSMPDRFRLELFSPIGIASLSTCDGHTLATYFPQEKTIYRGASTPLNVARFTRVMLAPRAVVSVLFGLPPFPQGGEARSVSLDAERGWYRLDLTLPEGGSQLWWFEQKTLWLMRWEVLADNDAVTARMNLADYRNVNGQVFPFEIVLTDLQNHQEAAIYYERVELNPSLPDTLFTLASINGVQEIDIDAMNP